MYVVSKRIQYGKIRQCNVNNQLLNGETSRVILSCHFLTDFLHSIVQVVRMLLFFREGINIPEKFSSLLATGEHD